MDLLNLPYLLLYLPLIFSVISILIPYNKTSISIVIVTVVAQILLLFTMIPDLIVNNVLQHSVNNEIMFLAGEYRLTPMSLCFLLCTFFIELISLINYKQEIDEMEISENKRFFYAFYILNYFAISGIFLTNNIFNLYFYLEIYSFTFYALIANYRDTKSSIIAFTYFISGVFGSILLLLFSFLIYIKFNTTDINIIKEGISRVMEKDFLSLSAILFIFLLGIINKFFSFWSYFSTIKKSVQVVSFLFISLMFIHIIVGSYLVINFLYYIFGTKIVFDVMNLEYTIYLLGSLIIIYNSYKIVKTQNLFFIVLSLCLINLGYIIIAIGNSDNFSLLNTFLFLMDHLSSNLFLYFVISFLIYNFQTVDIHYLKSLSSCSYIIYAVLLSKFCVPIGINFSASWMYLLSVFNNSQYYLLLPFVVEKLAMIVLIMKVRAVFVSNIIVEDFNLYEDNNNKRYIASIYLMFLLIIIMTVLTNKLPVLLESNNF